LMRSGLIDSGDCPSLMRLRHLSSRSARCRATKVPAASFDQIWRYTTVIPSAFCSNLRRVHDQTHTLLRRTARDSTRQ
jgi:hypothetical protein